MRFYFALLTLLLSCCWVTPMSAQTSGALRGRVVDSEGAGVGGAEVVAEQLEIGASRSTVAAADGSFVLPVLPVGEYRIRVSADGFRSLVRSGVELTVGQTVTLSVALEPGAFSDSIEVSATAPNINLVTGNLGFLVSEESISTLPLNGRNYTDLALLQPNVQEFTQRNGGSVVAHGKGLSVNGQDPRSNVYLLDGTLLNDFTNGPAGSAASTALGTETIREFRVETNAYGAEYGRNYGGQITLLTKSGSNRFKGSAFEFHRNDKLDSRNFFDTGEKPDFERNQLGATLGGPLVENRLFFFLGYEHLREDLGRTISTLVPDDNARMGLLPDPAAPGQLREVGVDPGVAPYLDAYPRQNGASIGGGIGEYTFPFNQTLREDFGQARIDGTLSPSQQLYARYTFDDAEQVLPTDFPQFPRAFVSDNRFFTAEYQNVQSNSTLHNLRFGYSGTEIGQDVEANLDGPVAPFVAGRPTLGNIDIGGLPRFGPQISADVNLKQDVYSLEYGLTRTWRSHLLEAGVLAERYENDMFNPTFSRGLFRFPSLERFLNNRPALFIGLTPEGDLERSWQSDLFAVYLQDQIQLGSKLSLNLGLRYETSSVPEEARGRDINLQDLGDSAPSVGRLYDNPTEDNWSPRFSFAWDPLGDGLTSVRGGWGLYYNTNNQQNLIVTITNPPFTPRPVIPGPGFPQPTFDRGSISIRPIQYDLESPELQVWNLTVEREIWNDIVLAVGYAGSRGRNLLRNSDANVPTPETLEDGTPFFPVGSRRPNSSFSTIRAQEQRWRFLVSGVFCRCPQALQQGLQVRCFVHLV